MVQPPGHPHREGTLPRQDVGCALARAEQAAMTWTDRFFRHDTVSGWMRSLSSKFPALARRKIGSRRLMPVD
jgi:hypothetical protein